MTEHERSWLKSIIEHELCQEVDDNFIKKVKDIALRKLLSEPFIFASANLIIRMSAKDVFFQEYGRKVEDVLNDS